MIATEHIKRLLDLIDKHRPTIYCCWEDSMLRECAEDCVVANAKAFLDSEDKEQENG